MNTSTVVHDSTSNLTLTGSRWRQCVCSNECV